jgi:hypothetical protein
MRANRHAIPGLTLALVVLLPCFVGFGFLADKIASDKTAEIVSMQLERCKANNVTRTELNGSRWAARAIARRVIRQAQEVIDNPATSARAKSVAIKDRTAATWVLRKNTPLRIVDCEAVIRPPG